MFQNTWGRTLPLPRHGRQSKVIHAVETRYSITNSATPAPANSTELPYRFQEHHAEAVH
jgi:hypothetical protein